MQIVGSVIAVVGRRREDGIKVDDRDAEPLEVGKLLADALKRAAIEVPSGDPAARVLLVSGIGVPVLDQATRGASVGPGHLCLDLLAPALSAREAVWKDLVDDAALVPLGNDLALWVIDRDLKRRWLAEDEGSLTAAVLAGGTVAPDRAVGCRDAEAVPDDLGTLGTEAHRKAQEPVHPLAHHVDELLALLIGPQTQRTSCIGLVPDVYGQRNGAAHLDSTEGFPIHTLRSNVPSSQNLPLLVVPDYLGMEVVVDAKVLICRTTP